MKTGDHYTKKQLQDMGYKIGAPPVDEPPKKKSKYRNEPTFVEDQRFDSKREAKHWQDLLLMKRKGLITQLERQVSYSFMVNGRLLRWPSGRLCQYDADMTYYDENGVFCVVDVKSKITMQNPVYKLKKMLMLHVNGVEIIEVL